MPATLDRDRTPTDVGGSGLDRGPGAASASGERVEAVALLDRAIPDVPLSPRLRLLMPLVAVVMLLLPVIYVALIAAVGYVTFVYLSGVLHLISVRGIWPEGLLLVPGVIGPVLLLFLLRPVVSLFSRDKELVLKRSEQPELFAYVERLCEITGAPMPGRIVVGLECNAGAGFSRGMLGVVGLGPLSLHIGLPLVGSMDLRCFTAVLAHELGHLTQGAYTRPNALIRRMNAWLFDAAYREDRFDVMIDRATRWAPGILSWAFFVAGKLMIVARRLLALLALLGYATSCLVTRELEYDADRFQTHVAGSASLERVFRQLALLGDAEQVFVASLDRAARNQRLSDNWVATVVGRAHHTPRERRAKVFEAMMAVGSNWLDTHPATRKRIERARDLREPGVLTDDRPAESLFRDFPALCRELTRMRYKAVLGSSFSDDMLVDSSYIIDEMRKAEQARQALRRFAQSDLLSSRPLPPTPDALKPASQPDKARAALAKAHEVMPRKGRKLQTLCRQWQNHKAKLLESRQQQALMQTAMEMSQEHAAELRKQMTSRADDADYREAELDRLAIEIDQAGKIVAVRMQVALSLMSEPDVVRKLGGDPRDHRRRVLALIRAGQALDRVRPRIDDLDSRANALIASSAIIQQAGGYSQRIADRLRGVTRETATILGDVAAQLSDVSSPFAPSGQPATLGEAVVGRVPDDQNLTDVIEAAMSALGQYVDLRDRVNGSLCLIVEWIEKVVGLEPHALPATEDALDQMLREIEQAEQERKKAGAWNQTGHIAGSALKTFAMVAVVAFCGIGVLQASEAMARVGEPKTDDTIPLAAGASPGQRDFAEELFSAGASVSNPASATRGDRETTNTGRFLDAAEQASKDAARTRSRIVPSTPPEQDKPDPLTSVADAVRALGSRDRDPFIAGLDYLANHEPEASRFAAVAEALAGGLVTHAGVRQDHVLSEAIRWSNDNGMAFFAANHERFNILQRRKMLRGLAGLESRASVEFILQHAETWSAFEVQRALSEHKGPVEAVLLDALPDADASRKSMVLTVLRDQATQLSADAVEPLLVDPDHSTRRAAEAILQRVAPRRVDAAARWIRSIPADSGAHAENQPEAEAGSGGGANTDTDVHRVVTDTQTLMLLDDLADMEPDDRLDEVARRIAPRLTSDSPSIRRRALAAAKAWPHASYADQVRRVVEDPESGSTEATAALALLAELGRSDDAERIAKWLLKEPEATTAALIAMGADSEAAARRHLAHDETSVRLACLEVLTEVGTARSLGSVRTLVRYGDEQVREAARNAYEQIYARVRAERE